MKTKVLFYLFIAIFVSCSGSKQSEITIREPISDDEDYAKILKEHSHKLAVYDNFDTVYSISTTYLSPSMVNALGKRYQDIFEESSHGLKVTPEKTAFFVSIYTPNRDHNDLKNKNIWKIFMHAFGKVIEPSEVVRIKPKVKWNAFFSDVTPWSQEFLLVFDSQVVGEKSVKGVKLVFANPEAKAHINF